MKIKSNNVLNTIFPNKKINIFVIAIIILGITSGAIFSTIIGINDKNLAIEKIKLFIDNINNNSYNILEILKNSLSINIIYTIIIWIMCLTLIGIIIAICLLYIKSFIIGFSLASFYLTYKSKGIILSLLYFTFGQALNIIAISILTIYGIIFTINLIKIILNKNNNKKNNLKNYLIILAIAIILNIISSLIETFILPSFIKLIIKLYI